MISESTPPFTLLGVGFSDQGAPVDKARQAVAEALGQTGGLPPALAVVAGADGSNMAPIVAEARKSLPGCTVLGCAVEPHALSKAFPRGNERGNEVGVLILASTKLKAKVGIGVDGGGSWEEKVAEAFAKSFIPHRGKSGFEQISEQWLIDWYLYRRPSLVLAVIVSPEAEKETRRNETLAFLEKKFRGRIPILTYLIAAEGAAGRLFADGDAVTDGIALITIKTDLVHKMERFHNFEPTGKKYFVTKADGRRVIELNNRPALPEYLLFQSDELSSAKSYASYFSLYPLAYRGREGRYHLFLPDAIHDDLSISLRVEPIREIPLLPMISISSAQAGLLSEAEDRDGTGKPGKRNLEIILRNDRLRDYYLPALSAARGEVGGQSLEINVDEHFCARLPEGDWEGETSHIAIRLKDEVEPLAVVANANERLLEEVFTEKSKMEALVEGLAESLYIVNKDYGLQFHHQGGGALSRLSEEPEGRLCYEAIFQRELPCPWCALTETLSTGQIVRQTVHLREEESHFQLTFSPWHDPVGQIDHSICLLVDVTAQHRMEEQLMKTKKLSSLSVLSAGMAHELNNPLGAINFNLEVLKGRESDPEYRDILDGIVGDVQRINRIIGNLLTFSRSGAKSGKPLDLKEVVESSVELLGSSMEKKKIRVAFDLPAAMPKIWGNFQDLQQVYINLLSNARDAMPAGGEVRVGARKMSRPASESDRNRMVVVYEGMENIDLLRSLQHEDGWETVYMRAGEESLDYFSASSLEPPDILLLALGETDRSRHLEELFALVADVCPLMKIISIEGAGEKIVNTLRSFKASGKRSGAREFLEVTVADDGIGIAQEKIERIFDPFFTTKDERRGTGMGLSVVHKILENHGAFISVESTVGEGTTFIIRYPLMPESEGAGQEPYFKEKRSSWGKMFS